MKRFLKIAVLTVAIVMATAACAFAATPVSAGSGQTAAKYTITDDVLMTAEYTQTLCTGDTVKVPNYVTISGYDYYVTSIGEKAFFGNTTIKRVNVANTVDVIGAHAFEECTHLESIYLKKGLKEIGEDAFFHCTRLNDIVVPASVRTLGKGAFFGCKSLTSINVPAKIKTIENYTFSQCSKLARVSGCDRVESVGSRAFRDCTSLKTINLTWRVYNVGSRAFYNCSKLQAINLTWNLDTLGENAFFNCSKLKTVKLACEKVPYQAFYCCSSLKTVTFVGGVKSIGNMAFSGTNLSSVTLPYSVNNVDPQAFPVEKFKSYKVNSSNRTYKAVDGVLYNKKTKTLISFPMGKSVRTYTLIKGTKGIGDRAFADQNTVTTIKVNKGFKRIGKEAFSYSALMYINLPATTNKLGVSAFEGSRIQSITLPAKIKIVPANTFSFCSELSSVTMKGVRTIGANAFSYTGDLKKLNIPASATKIAGNFLSGSNVKTLTAAKGGNFKVVDGVLFDDEKTTLVAYPSGKKAKAYDVPEGVVTIGSGAFERSNLKDIQFPESLTEIQDGAFVDCSMLGEDGFGISIPSTVTTIGEKALGYSRGYEGISQYPATQALIIAEQGSAAADYAAANDIALAQDTPGFEAKKVTLSGAGTTANLNILNVYPGTVKLYSSDTSVATVKDTTVTAVGGGSTTIVAAINNYYFKCSVTVDAPVVASSSRYSTVNTYSDLQKWESSYYAYNQSASFGKLDNPAVRLYTSNDYYAIKMAIGTPGYETDTDGNYGDDVEEYAEVAECMKQELRSFKLASSTELYSGTKNVDVFTGTNSTLDAMEAIIGSTVDFDGFISTSVSSAVAGCHGSGSPYQTVLHVLVPSGAGMNMYVPKISYYPNEVEVLMDRNARYKVVDAGVRYVSYTDFATGEEYDAGEGYERYLTLEYLGPSAS